MEDACPKCSPWLFHHCLPIGRLTAAQHSLDFALLTWLVRSEPSFLSTGKRKEMKWTRFRGDPQGLQFILRRPVGGNPTSRSTFSPKDLPNLKTQQKHPSFLWKRLLHIPTMNFQFIVSWKLWELCPTRTSELLLYACVLGMVHDVFTSSHCRNFCKCYLV